MPIAPPAAYTAHPGASSASGLALPPMLPPGSVYTACYCEENVYLLAQAFTTQKDAEIGWSWDIHAVFISNARKTVALWEQKLGAEGVVVWDYHVVLVLRPQRPSPEHLQRDAHADGSPFRSSWVYDFDTRLPNPCLWTDYIWKTFPYIRDPSALAESHRSLLRVVPADAYLAWFASDRSHMLKPSLAGARAAASAPLAGVPLGMEYASPPPPYSPLCGCKAQEAGITHNLMEFVSMFCARAEDDSGSGGSAGGDVESVPAYGEVMDMSCFVSWLAGDDSDGGGP